MTLDDVLKIALVLLILATTIAIFGLSIQLMRSVGTLNDILRDGKKVSTKLADELLKIKDLRELLNLVSDVIVENVISKQLGRLRKELIDSLVSNLKLFITQKL